MMATAHGRNRKNDKARHMSTSKQTRKATSALLALVDEGVLDSRQVLLCALVYMSERDVADMARLNELLEEEEEEGEEDQSEDE
jgi:predicted deacetylase